MKKEHLLHSKRFFALHHTSYFFTVGFYSCILLISLCLIILSNRISTLHQQDIYNLISLSPLNSLSFSSTVKCPDSNRLIFSYKMPGFSKYSCYKPDDSLPNSLELGSGWFKCKSLFFKSFKLFEETTTKNIYNLGSEYICGGSEDLDINDFEYIPKDNATRVNKGSISDLIDVILTSKITFFLYDYLLIFRF